MIEGSNTYPRSNTNGMVRSRSTPKYKRCVSYDCACVSVASKSNKAVYTHDLLFIDINIKVIGIIIYNIRKPRKGSGLYKFEVIEKKSETASLRFHFNRAAIADGKGIVTGTRFKYNNSRVVLDRNRNAPLCTRIIVSI